MSVRANHIDAGPYLTLFPLFSDMVLNDVTE